MKRFLRSDAGAAVLWMCGALLMAAVFSPWLYRGGMWLAGEAATRELPRLVEWLGRECGRSADKFGRYFDRTLLASALILLPLLLRRIRALRREADAHAGLPLVRVPWQSAIVQIVIGFIIAGGLLWSLGELLHAAGASSARPHPPAAGKLVRAILLPAIFAPLVEESLFRGLLLGLWLRFTKPAAACVGTSLLFAFLHFIDPPEGTVIADPRHALAGFELLGKILYHFTNPLFFVTDFATLFAIGMILAWARVRTGALWLSIGLHAGWVAAFKTYNLLYKNVDDSPLHPWGVGEDLKSGVLPMATLLLTAALCHFALRRFGARGEGVSRASR